MDLSTIKEDSNGNATCDLDVKVFNIHNHKIAVPMRVVEMYRATHDWELDADEVENALSIYTQSVDYDELQEDAEELSWGTVGTLITEIYGLKHGFI